MFGASLALRDEPRVRQWSPRGGHSRLPGSIGVFIAALIVGCVIAGCDELPPTSSSTRGSGVSVTDRRDVAAFTSVELAGANTVAIHVGAPRSVAVTSDDNLVDRITTVVRDGRLVIDDTGTFSTKAPMRVTVSLPSLEGVELSGAGTV